MMATYIAVILITLVLMSIYILSILSENLYGNEEIKLFAKEKAEVFTPAF